MGAASAATEAPEIAGALPWPELPPWQRARARDLAAQRERWPHALLLHGPRGVGKHALALALAQSLLCESPRSDGLGCGACPGCRYVIAGQHPDLLRVELLEIDEDDGSLKAVDTIAIKRIRAVTDFALLTSHRQRAKVATIAPAERMNAAAANALLKTLEEPPPGTYLILAADAVGRLPATIVSRCRQVRVPLPPADEALAWLAAAGIAEPAHVLAQAGGAPLAALALADPEAQKERRHWLSALADPRRLPVIALAARIEGGGRDERRPRLGRALDWMSAWVLDLVRVRCGGSARFNPDFAGELRTLAPRVAPVAGFRYHDFLLRQRAMLAHPLQPRLVAEAALFDYQALFPRVPSA